MSENKKYRICSWDVGIKNLAYCILEFDIDNYKIIKWDIINLVKNNSHMCSGKFKNGKDCNKKASFYAFNGNNNIYFCGTHKKKYKPFEDNWEKNKFNLIKKEESINNKCEYLLPKKKIICNKNSKYKSEDHYYCSAHCRLLINRIKKERSINKIKRKKCTSEDMIFLAKTMYNELDKIKELLDVKDVLIENQPGLKHPTMKTISSLLYAYFVMRGIIDKDGKNDQLNNVKFVCPSNKLKVNEDQTMEVLTGTKGKEKYNMTKELGIKYTKIMLKDNKQWLDYLNSYKKKDDLCDAFLQGYYQYNKEKIRAKKNKK